MLAAGARAPSDLAEDVRLGEALRADLDGLRIRLQNRGQQKNEQRAQATPHARSCAGRVARELQRGEPRIQPALAHELGMRAFGDDRAALHDDDAVGVRTVASRCAMASVVRPFSSASSARCTTRSLAASSELVASSSSRIGAVGEQRARDREALALAAGERHAALAERGVESLRQALDELEREGRARTRRAPRRVRAPGLP